MTIKKTITASAIALALGLGISTQAFAGVASGVDHVTSETNPAVFSDGEGMLKSGYAYEGVDHVIEKTMPQVFGSYDGQDNETADNSDVLPYQRG